MIELVLTVLVGMITICVSVYFWMRPEIERVRKRREKMLQILRTQRPWEYAELKRTGELPSDEMHKHAKDGSVAKLRACVKENEFHVDRENRHGETALMVAARQNQTDIIKALIDLKARLDIPGKEGLAALHICATIGNVEAAKVLIKAKADMNVLSITSDEGGSQSGPDIPLTPLLLSILKKRDGVTRLLLESKASVQTAEKKKDPQGPIGHQGHHVDMRARAYLSPIHCAVRTGARQAIIQTLIQSGVGSTR